MGTDHEKTAMRAFPEYMKRDQNQVPTTAQNTPDIVGYYYTANDGSQMAFWECYRARATVAIGKQENVLINTSKGEDQKPIIEYNAAMAVVINSAVQSSSADRIGRERL